MRRKMENIQNLAIEAAQLASNYILKMWNCHQTAIKEDGTIVTNVDIQAEKIIYNSLKRITPSTAIFGEELGNINLNTNQFWIIDSIDGTRWYNLGVPLFGSLIAFVEDREPILGIISLPVTKEIIYAAKNGGCYYLKDNIKQKLVTSKAQSINESTISVSGLHGSDLWLENGSKPYCISRLPSIARGFYFTGDCIQHSLVARGKFDAAIDTIMRPWDLAAIIPCIKEAGGYVCSLEGESENLLQENTLLSCATATLAEQILKIVKP